MNIVGCVCVCVGRGGGGGLVGGENGGVILYYSFLHMLV